MQVIRSDFRCKEILRFSNGETAQCEKEAVRGGYCLRHFRSKKEILNINIEAIFVLGLLGIVLFLLALTL